MPRTSARSGRKGTRQTSSCGRLRFSPGELAQTLAELDEAVVRVAAGVAYVHGQVETRAIPARSRSAVRAGSTRQSSCEAVGVLMRCSFCQLRRAHLGTRASRSHQQELDIAQADRRRQLRAFYCRAHRESFTAYVQLSPPLALQEQLADDDDQRWRSFTYQYPAAWTSARGTTPDDARLTRLTDSSRCCGTMPVTGSKGCSPTASLRVLPPTCPTYGPLWQEEMDSPREAVYLMDMLSERRARSPTRSSSTLTALPRPHRLRDLVSSREVRR